MMRSLSLAVRSRWPVAFFLQLAAAVLAAGSARAADIEGVAVHGFLDAGYTETTLANPPNGSTGFRIGTLDLYLSPQLGDRIKSLMEVVWEFDSWYGDGQPATDIERFQVGYTISDDMTVWLGRFHTPYGYWNTAFHHGAQLQPSVLRPQFLAFEDHGGILPAHTVGLWLTGHKSQADTGRITYDVYVGNGSRIVPTAGIGQLDMNSVGDNNGNRAYGGRLGYQFENGVLDGLWIGVHGMKEEVDAYLGAGALPTSKTDFQMLGGFVQWDHGNFELLGEFYHFDDKDLPLAGSPTNGSTNHSSNAGYVQGSYIFQGRITPYLRFETTTLDQKDGYFTSQDGGKSYRRGLLGVRYDVTPAAALKIEADRTDATRDGGTKYTNARVQLAVRF